MKKEFEFSMKLDTAAFDESIRDMQRKLKDSYSSADQIRMQSATAGRLGMSPGMPGGLMSQPTQDAFNKTTMSARRDMDQAIASQAREQEKLGKLIAQRSDMIKKLQTQQNDLIKGSKEELAVKEKLARVEENNYRLREQYKQRDAAINQVLDAKEALGPVGGGRGKGGSGGGDDESTNPRSRGFNFGALGKGMTTAAGIVAAGSEIYRGYGQAPISTDVATGNAVQGSLGTNVQNIYARRTGFEQNFAGERASSAQMALDAMSKARLADKGRLGADALAVGGGALSSLTGVGTIPGLIAAGGGALDMLTNSRTRALALSPFSKTFSNQYESMIGEEGVSNYNQEYEARKKQNPFKTAAVGEYEQNYMRNLNAQRSMGIGNEQFYGDQGFLRSGTNAGFTPEMQLQMSQGIMSAGGSSRSAFGNATFANQLARGNNLTNAANVMGSLSGGMGGSESTRQATIKILAEGTKLGLDDSKFAEENRRFTQTVADIVAKSGAQAGGDVDRVSGGFGRFVGENTNLGISAAKTAYDQYQGISSTTTGPRGVMRAAGFLNDPALSQLSTIEKTALMQVPESDLNESNTLVRGAAQKLGMSPSDLASKISEKNQNAVSRFGDADKIRDRLKGTMKEMGISQMTDEQLTKMPKDFQQDFYQLQSYQTAELGYQGSREGNARTYGTLNPGGGGGAAAEAAVLGKATGETGKIEDATVKSMAADSGTVLKNFNEMAPAMKLAADEAAGFTDKIRELAAELNQALEDSRSGKKDAGNVAAGLLEQLAKSRKTQPQAGKVSK